MNTNDYDRIIDLYLDGGLNPVEEREFRTLLEIDPDLHRLLDAELAVRRTLVDDAEAVPVETERSYARFVAALAATAPAGSATSGDGGATSAASGASTGGGWLPAGYMKLAGAAAVALGLATGGYLALDSDDGIEPARPAAVTAPATAPRLPRPAITNPEVAAPTRTGPATDAASSTTAFGGTMRTEASAKAGRPDGTKGGTLDATTRSSAAGSLEAPETKALVDPHDDLTEIEKAIEPEQDLPIIENDSVSARIDLRSRK